MPVTNAVAEPTPVPLDPQVCERARLSRDVRFDGLFFTAVVSTGIYCRPVCPAPVPKRANVRYYANAAAAEEAGFRPCLRCRPELSPLDGRWRKGDSALGRALALVNDGYLDAHSVADLAARVHLGERQLRRLFIQQLGASPLRVATTRRLLFAKQLLTETPLPITDVALASGFASLRRFNAAVLAAWQMPPSRMRRQPVVPAGGRHARSPSVARTSAPPEMATPGNDVLVLRLHLRPPYDLAGMLDFLRARAIPGLEQVGAQSYLRHIGRPGAPAWFAVSPWPGVEAVLQLRLHGVPVGDLPAVVRNVRRMFDLDADPRSIHAALLQDEGLREQVAACPGQRIPGGWSGFETAVRAVLGQQVSVAAARTLATRLVQGFGAAAARSGEAGMHVGFPGPEQLASADLRAIGLTQARAQTIQTLAQALLEERVDFRPDQSLAEFVQRWCALPGIGPWTAHYIAMRALGHPDAFPAGDLVLQKALAPPGERLSATALEARSQAWRPWRAYAVFHLWRQAASAMAARRPQSPPLRAQRAL